MTIDSNGLQKTLHVGCPNIGERQRFFDLVNGAFDRRRLSNDGQLVRELESQISRRLGVKHCIAVSSGTAGLDLATRALNMCSEVIVPSFTFIGTAHALAWQHIKPVFCDIDPKTHNLDSTKVEALISERTGGIIGVHLWGRACAPDALAAVARRHNLPLLFDAAHAIDCTHRGRYIGSFGDAEVFSFHATKVFNTAEGGAITTNNDVMAERLRRLRNFGFDGYDHVAALGSNCKMCELSAALGLANLESLDRFIASNRRNFEQYRQELTGIPGVSLASYDEAERNNYQYVMVLIDATATGGIDRNGVMATLHAHNILARRYFWPGCHRMEPYVSLYPEAGAGLNETERIAAQIMALPNGETVQQQDITRICGLIRGLVESK